MATRTAYEWAFAESYSRLRFPSEADSNVFLSKLEGTNEKSKATHRSPQYYPIQLITRIIMHDKELSSVNHPIVAHDEWFTQQLAEYTIHEYANIK